MFRMWSLRITVIFVSYICHALILHSASAMKEVNVRSCLKDIRPKHITLSVGHDPSSEMILSFASTLSHYEVSPIAGVIVSKNRNQLRTFTMNSEDLHSSRKNNMNDPNEDGILVYVEDHEHDSPTSYQVPVSSSQHANVKGNWYCSPYYHHITIRNLQPNTKYYYKLLLHTNIESFQSYEKYFVKNSINQATKPNHDMEVELNKNELLHILETSTGDIITTGSSSRVSNAMKIVEGNENIQPTKTAIDDAIMDDDDDEGKHRMIRKRRNHRRYLKEYYDNSQHDCPTEDLIRSFETASSNGECYNHHHRDTNRIKKIAIVGDVGQASHSVETIQHMHSQKDDIALIILSGDIAYSEYDHKRWDTFMDMLDDYGELSHYTPLMIVPGNHDIDKLEHDTSIFLAYENRFRMPRIQTPILKGYHGDGSNSLLDMDKPPYPLDYEYGNAYYSYPYGNAYFIMINSYSSMNPSSIQYNWIVSTLQTIDRNIYPWVFIVLHTPMYNTFGYHRHDNQILAAKQYIEPLLIEYQVNVVFSGHIHAYLRTSPVTYDQVNRTGPIHITVGAGGHSCDAPFVSIEPEPWVEVRDATYYGYGTLSILNNTHCQWEWVHTGGHSDKHPTNNEVYHTNITLPSGPTIDIVYLENQYYLNQ
jgi:acid phosphatase type 7